MWFWRLASLGCAGVLDLSVGMFLVQILSGYFAYPLHWWQYVVGALLGAAPDIDLLYALLRKKNPNGHHEYLTHRPIVGIPLAISLGLLFGGPFWACAAGAGVLWHYLHDTEGFLGLTGGGIAWFWPFSKKYWGMRGSNAKVFSWMFEEDRKGERNVSDEFSETYLKPTRRSITEFVLTGLFFGYVIGDTFGLHAGFATAYLFWIGIAGMWIMYRLRPRSA